MNSSSPAITYAEKLLGQFQWENWYNDLSAQLSTANPAKSSTTRQQFDSENDEIDRQQYPDVDSLQKKLSSWSVCVQGLKQKRSKLDETVQKFQTELLRLHALELSSADLRNIKLIHPASGESVAKSHDLFAQKVGVLQGLFNRMKILNDDAAAEIRMIERHPQTRLEMTTERRKRNQDSADLLTVWTDKFHRNLSSLYSRLIGDRTEVGTCLSDEKSVEPFDAASLPPAASAIAAQPKESEACQWALALEQSWPAWCDQFEAELDGAPPAYQAANELIEKGLDYPTREVLLAQKMDWDAKLVEFERKTQTVQQTCLKLIQDVQPLRRLCLGEQALCSAYLIDPLAGSTLAAYHTLFSSLVDNLNKKIKALEALQMKAKNTIEHLRQNHHAKLSEFIEEAARGRKPSEFKTLTATLSRSVVWFGQLLQRATPPSVAIPLDDSAISEEEDFTLIGPTASALSFSPAASSSSLAQTVPPLSLTASPSPLSPLSQDNTPPQHISASTISVLPRAERAVETKQAAASSSTVPPTNEPPSTSSLSPKSKPGSQPPGTTPSATAASANRKTGSKKAKNRRRR